MKQVHESRSTFYDRQYHYQQTLHNYINNKNFGTKQTYAMQGSILINLVFSDNKQLHQKLVSKLGKNISKSKSIS